MNNNFKENLRRIRKENNLSQEQLADELGVSRQAISKWESGAAYPEMDKIIALCDKFNLNIDDLLHKDIKEIKGEEESKKKLNIFINDFLKFITNTINMFSNMNLKSKIKCLFEQFIIAFILFIVSFIIYNVLSSLFSNVLIILPNIIYTFLSGVLKSILVIALVIVSIIIITHIFKTRYLNYYEKVKEEKNNKESEDKIKDENQEFLKNNEDRIIIRDSRHSEYNFINMLFKFIIIIIKIFATWFGLCIAFVLVCLFGSFIASFLMYKTGLFFIGLLIAILSASVIGIVILLLIINFIFNRKNDKKKMIWSFIISLITFGIGCGLTFVGTLSFNIIYDNEHMLKTVTREYDMKEDLIITNNYGEIEYIETDDKNIKIEYQINKYCEIDDNSYNNYITAWTYCENPIEIAKEYIKNINDKKIIPINSSIEKMTVYTNKTNIETLKNNWNNNMKQTENNRIIDSYEERINELKDENKELKQEIEELKNQLDD